MIVLLFITGAGGWLALHLFAPRDKFVLQLWFLCFSSRNHGLSPGATFAACRRYADSHVSTDIIELIGRS